MQPPIIVPTPGRKMFRTSITIASPTLRSGTPAQLHTQGAKTVRTTSELRGSSPEGEPGRQPAASRPDSTGYHPGGTQPAGANTAAGA